MGLHDSPGRRDGAGAREGGRPIGYVANPRALKAFKIMVPLAVKLLSNGAMSARVDKDALGEVDYATEIRIA
jgi:hypothetical protein